MNILVALLLFLVALFSLVGVVGNVKLAGQPRKTLTTADVTRIVIVGTIISGIALVGGVLLITA
jgi:hypothetical protein